MSQNTTDNLVMLALLLTLTGDLIALFVEIKNQRQAQKQQDLEIKNKNEIAKLQHEISMLKTQLKSK